jgi:hypothetical protein
MHRFMVYLGALFVDDDDRKGAILDSWIAAQPPRKIPAVLDSVAGALKF